LAAKAFSQQTPMPQRKKISLEAPSDAVDDESWFLDSLTDLHYQAKQIISDHLTQLLGTHS
jgi:hypothetical protein